MMILRRGIHVLLFVVAVLLITLAIVTVSLRISPWQIESASSLTRWLPLPADTAVNFRSISIGLKGHDLEISADDLNVSAHPSNGVSHSILTLAHGKAQLNLWRSIILRQPVFDNIMLDRPALRFDQHDDGRWWQEGDSKSEFVFDKNSLARWIKNVAGTRAQVIDGHIDFFGLAEHRRIEVTQARLSSDVTGNAGLELAASLSGAKQPGITLNARVSSLHSTSGQAELHADAEQVSTIANLFTTVFNYSVRTTGQLRAELQWQSMADADMRVELDIPALHLVRLNNKSQPLDLQKIAGAVAVNYKDGNWRGAFARLGAQDTHGQVLELPRYGSLRGTDDELAITLPSFHLDPANLVWGVMPFSPKLRKAYLDMQPRGVVKGAELDIDLRSGVIPRDRVRLRASVDGARISHHDEIPAVGPVSGWVDTTFHKGWAQLHGDRGVTLSMPRVFARDWRLDSLDGRLEWALEKKSNALTGRNITLVRDNGSRVSGQLGLWLPDEDRKKFTLDIDLNDGVLNDPLEWVPVHTISPALGQWMTKNVHSARVPHGQLNMEMVFGAPDHHPELERKVDFEDPDSDSHLKLQLKINDGVLSYLDHWPALEGIDGSLSLEGAEIQGSIDHAQLKGLRARNGSFSLHDQVLKVGAPIEGDAQDMLAILQQAPFEDKSLNKQFQQWSAHGPLSGKAEFRMAFEGKDAHRAHFMAQGDVHGGSASLDAKQLVFSDVDANGRFVMDHDDISLSGNAKGQTLGGGVKGVAALKNGVGQVAFSGRANALNALQWLNISGLIPNITGDADYQGKLFIAHQGGAVNLSLESNLMGIEVPLPKPLGKQAAERDSMKLDMNLTDGEGQVDIANRLRARWRDQMQQGQIWIQQWPDQPQWQQNSGWHIDWQSPRIDPMEWKNAIAALDMTRIGKPKKTGLAIDGLSGDSVDVSDKPLDFNGGSFATNCLVFSGKCLGRIEVDASKHQNDWNALISGPVLNGRVSWTPESRIPIVIDLDNLSLDVPLDLMVSHNKVEKKIQGSLYSDVFTLAPQMTPLVAFPSKMSSVPDGHITVHHLHARDYDGSLGASWHASDDSLKMSDLDVQIADARLTGNLSWERAGEASLTKGNAKLRHKDIGKLLTLLDQPVVVQTPGGGEFNATFAWPGAPWQPDWRSVTGTLKGKVNKGVFPTVDSSSARLIGLFNLDNLLRRMRLDFTDLTSKGTAFNSISGNLSLSDGLLTNNEPVRIVSPATQILLDGQVDLIRRTLDQQLSITLPVSETLPLAAIAAGAPEIGGVLLVLHWMFGRWVDQVTELHYVVTGPWTEPTFRMESAK